MFTSMLNVYFIFNFYIKIKVKVRHKSKKQKSKFKKQKENKITLGNKHLHSKSQTLGTQSDRIEC